MTDRRCDRILSMHLAHGGSEALSRWIEQRWLLCATHLTELVPVWNYLGNMDDLFRMFRVDAAEAQRIAAAPDDPHQHGFEELIIGMEGQLEHFIDFQTSTISAPFVSFVTK